MREESDSFSKQQLIISETNKIIGKDHPPSLFIDNVADLTARRGESRGPKHGSRF